MHNFIRGCTECLTINVRVVGSIPTRRIETFSFLRSAKEIKLSIEFRLALHISLHNSTFSYMNDTG